MSAETNPAALATRAAEELAQGGYEIAKATALVAIAGALAAGLPELVDEATLVAAYKAGGPGRLVPLPSIREQEPNGYEAGIREGMRRSALYAFQWAAEHDDEGTDRHMAISKELIRLGDVLERDSTGHIAIEQVPR